MICDKIKKLDDLLCNYLKPNKSIKHVDVSRLTAPGENYGSVMYKLDITIENRENSKEEMLHAVAKTIPENPLLRLLFKIQTTYTNEMAFYQIIIPTILDFQKELNISKTLDCFPRCLGIRKNLEKNSDVIDENAVLLLENLAISGFTNIDRNEGFDLETSKLVLRDLAEFHGVTLALKLYKPHVFEKNVKPYCHDFEHNSELMRDLIALVANEDQECAKILSTIPNFGRRPRPMPNEPFATIVHDDLWTNNTMQKFENGKPIANKMVDFQIYSYGSPATDVFFYLWSSVPLDVLKNHIDQLIEYYHGHFVDIMKIYACDVKPFSLEAFMEEIKRISQFEFYHALFFHLIAVQAPKGGLDITKMPTPAEIVKNVSSKAKEKTWYMIKECYKREWLR
ncbi:uncharacterized protein LOC130893484 [Diorhabda carinulata]|uniref:uncharacterized protein LOC130893484 n=1 Tax=Diorhabda carinulata TaxID=1163345 RepID=UPI0025A2C677|nr:uncharacterized protein LOC130893484 [Diorhabda carinulata]XP_057655647.1 uncharacterized protein LOC130893484 [Diorhabda carinulata]XP_057655648.1 uncharacterized protein LOC130893484 [Diorhabda carinulata]